MKKARFSFQLAGAFLLGVTPVGYSSVLASEPGHVAAARVSIESYRHYLDDMLYAHDGDNRGWPDGPDHDLARDNIAMLFSSFGLDVALHEFEYAGNTGHNVVATKWGTLFLNQEYILGAHYDSVFNPGADDNASGVALVLEAARVLSAYESEHTIRFIAFDAEEWGLIGSEAYVLDHIADDILGAIIPDMVAYNDGSDTMSIVPGQDSGDLETAMIEAADTYCLTLGWTLLPGGGSDHYAFEDAGFEATAIHENQDSPYYHSELDSVDTPDYIDYAYAAEITRSTVGFLVDHAGVLVDDIPDADYDGDGDVDQDDFNEFQLCFSGSEVPVDPPCDFFDLDLDGDVDCPDWRLFAAVWTETEERPLFAVCNPQPPVLVDTSGRCILVELPGPGTPIALKVTGDASDPTIACVSAYAQADGRLGPGPVFQTSDAWGTVWICDESIVPDASYGVRCAYGQPGSPVLSNGTTAVTRLWGDVVGDFVGGAWTPPNATVDFNDITSVVDAFKHLPTAPPLFRADQVGASGSECVPNLDIDFLDISAAVEAFKGYDYWETTSCPPPCD